MSQPITGLTIGLGLDTAGVDQGMKQLRSKLSLVNSEMRSNMSAFERGEKSVQKYETQITTLNRKLDVQKAAVNETRREYERMVQQHGEGSRQAEQAARAYNNQVAALNNTERSLENLNNELREFQDQQRLAESGWTRMSESLTTTGDRLTKFGSGMKNVGKSMSMYVTTPIVGIGAAAAKLGIDFDDTMAKVQAISGATGGDLELLRDKAKEMGATTKFSASEAAEGLTFMAMAGWKTEDMLSGLPGIMSLAAASGEDLATVSDIVTDAMTAFGLTAEESGRFADVLASASSNANTNVSMLGASFKYVAPVAGALGMSVEDSALALGLMANAGIKADQSGTALRTMLTNLAKPTKQMQGAMDELGISLTNQDGSMKTLDEVMINLRESFTGLTKDQQASSAAAIFGKEAMSGALSIINASQSDYDKLAGAIRNSEGAADEMAETMGATLGGTLREIKSGIEGFAISLYEEMQPSLQTGADMIKGFVGWMNELSPEAKKAALGIGAFAAAIGPVLVVGGTLIGSLGAIFTGLGTVSAAIGVVTTGVASTVPAVASLASIFTVLTGPVGIAAAAIAGITVAGIGLYNHLKQDAIPEIDRFGDEVSDTTKEALGNFFDLSDGVSEAMMDLKINAGTVTDELATDLVGKFSEMNTQILEGMKSRHAEQLESTRQFFTDSSVLTEEEEASILQKQQWANDMQIAGQEAKEARIKEIMDTASKEKRKLTETEQIEINAIQATMNDTAVRELSANEVEQKIIFQRMKDSASELSALQAAEVVKRSAEQRDGTIANAEEEYEKRLAEIIRLRDESGDISEEQATKLIAEAKKTRDQTVGHAETMHNDVVKEAKEQAKEHVNEVDWSTGEILTKWQYHTERVKRNFTDFKENTIRDFKAFGEGYTRIMDNMIEAVNTWGRGVVSRFKESSQDSVNAIGKMVNGAIDGVNWALGKLGISKFPRWNIPTLFKSSGGGGGGRGGNRNSVVAYAHGTDHHPGGPAIVGDGKGANAGRELIHTPDGKFTLSPSKDTLVDLPKGSSVLSARETKSLFKGIPMYANGIGNIFAGIKKFGTAAINKGFDIWNYITNPSKLLDLAFKAFGVGSPTDGRGTFAAELARGGFNKIKEGAIGYLKKQLAKYEEENGGTGPGFGRPFVLTSRRGWRTHPITGKRTFHQGDDWGAPLGTRIPSQSGGTVSATGYHSARGNFIRVKSGIYEHLYQHNLRNSLRRGDQVRRGQTVGLVGSTGMSTGPHLHHELKKNGVNINPSGLETGGLVSREQLVRIGEKGREEVVIPLHPSRRTDAMKLLALVGKRLGGEDKGITRPNQLPPLPGGQGNGVLEELLAATLNQNQILMQLLNKNSDVYLDTGVLAGAMTPEVSRNQGSNYELNRLMRGR